MLIKKSTLVIASILLLSTPPSFAAVWQAKGLYIDLNAGYGKVNEKIAGSDLQDNEDLGLSGDVGYQFNPYFAIEAGGNLYPNEKFDDDVTGNNNFAVFADLKGILPFGTSGFSLFVKAGGAGVHHTLTGDVENEGSSMRPAFYGAAGASYAITTNLAINVEASATTKYDDTTPPMYLFTGGISYILP